MQYLYKLCKLPSTICILYLSLKICMHKARLNILPPTKWHLYRPRGFRETVQTINLCSIYYLNLHNHFVTKNIMCIKLNILPPTKWHPHYRPRAFGETAPNMWVNIFVTHTYTNTGHFIVSSLS